MAVRAFSVLFVLFVCDDSTISQCVPPAPLDSFTTYYWRIVSTDSRGLSNESTTWSFQTSDIEPDDLIYANGFE